jgi:glycosyltransferase involved in cell wall biosynthesis
MAQTDGGFSLETFEYLCYSRNRELAARELIKLLDRLDSQYGALTGIEAGISTALAERRNANLLTRIASAMSCLFSDPEFFLSPRGFTQLIAWHRWIAALFAASPFGNADHVLRAMNVKGTAGELELTEAGFVKFCLLYTPDSEIAADVEALWKYNRRLAAALFLALLSPRFLGTEASHSKREALLGWLPARLEEVEDLDQLPLAILHDVYVHCSYADLPQKHEIKRTINRLIRRKIVKEGLGDFDLGAPRGMQNGKPVLVVVLEWFTSTHSIFRTHSASMRALRERFHVVGMGLDRHVDAAGRAVFDEFVTLTGDLRDMLAAVRNEVSKRKPAILYYPAVGMFQLTIYLSNMRLAPIQVAALGHGASSMSPFVDYFAVDEDFVGDPATFSEKLILLPVDGMPHVRSSEAVSITPRLREKPDVVRIAIAATTMKLNPRMMRTLRKISDTAKVPVHFEFLTGFASGLVREQVGNFVRSYLANATVHQHQPYGQYMEHIAGCDLFLNPFPYGNMNGIVDMAMAGLVGICRTGPQVHEHIDEGMFRRAGLPDWLVAKTDEEYAAAAVRLIENHDERLALRRGLVARGGDQVYLKGRPQVLGERFVELMRALS